MDFKKLGIFLSAVACILAFYAGISYVQWQKYPEGQSAEASRLRSVVLDGSYVEKLQARRLLDEMYLRDKQRPASVDHSAYVAFGLLVLGVGLIVSAKE
jgi:hypothetical protein